MPDNNSLINLYDAINIIVFIFIVVMYMHSLHSTDTDTMTDKLNRSQPTALEFVEFMIILMRSEDITQLWWVYEGKMG